MNFDELYNKVFIKEQNLDDKSEVADPADFDDVEPMPLPPTDLATDNMTPDSSTADTGIASASSLNDYITQLESFADKLNSTDGNSLNSLVSKLDRVETPFEGISSTRADIVNAAKTLREVSEKIKNYIIHAAKK